MLPICVTIRQMWACHIDNIYTSCDTEKSGYMCHMTYKYYLYGMPIFDVL